MPQFKLQGIEVVGKNSEVKKTRRSIETTPEVEALIAQINKELKDNPLYKGTCNAHITQGANDGLLKELQKLREAIKPTAAAVSTPAADQDDKKTETPADGNKTETPTDDDKTETPADDDKNETPTNDDKTVQSDNQSAEPSPPANQPEEKQRSFLEKIKDKV